MQTTVNQSTSFLIGLVPYKIRYRTLLYVGHEGINPDEWGEYLYIKGSDVEQAYAEHGISVDIIDVDNHLYRVKIDEKTFHTIVHPFLEGKYSAMDKGYVNKTFSTGNSGLFKYSSASGFEDTDVGKSLQWLVCHQHEKMREMWEERLGVDFSEDQELWSKPCKENEIYAYENSPKYSAESARTNFGAG